mmetsp:Transcript_51782/g.107033  ORF Transcript_51782/g.107033 Transcript_51782/m.107033 type:complete len:216 (+) Transcript_51782:270-917(+)
MEKTPDSPVRPTCCRCEWRQKHAQTIQHNQARHGLRPCERMGHESGKRCEVCHVRDANLVQQYLRSHSHLFSSQRKSLQPSGQNCRRILVREVVDRNAAGSCMHCKAETQLGFACARSTVDFCNFSGPEAPSQKAVGLASQARGPRRSEHLVKRHSSLGFSAFLEYAQQNICCDQSRLFILPCLGQYLVAVLPAFQVSTSRHALKQVELELGAPV